MGLVGYYNKMDHGCGMSLPLMMALVFIAMSSIGEAQTVPPCAEVLSPCLDYLNSTNPPKYCCDPMKDLAATQLPCFCKFLLTPGMLDLFGINITQAFQFGHHCHVPINITDCQAAISAQPPSSSSSPVQPAATPGGACRISFTGLSFILLLYVTLLFH